MHNCDVGIGGVSVNKNTGLRAPTEIVVHKSMVTGGLGLNMVIITTTKQKKFNPCI